MRAIVVMTENHTETVAKQIITAGFLILVPVLIPVLLLVESALDILNGKTGARVISRVMGTVLAKIPVDAKLGAPLLSRHHPDRGSLPVDQSSDQD